MTFITECDKIIKRIVALILGGSFALAINMMNVKVVRRGTSYAFIPISFMRRYSIATIIIIFFSGSFVFASTSYISTEPFSNLAHVILLLAIFASVLVGCSEYGIFSAGRALKNTTYRPSTTFFTVSFESFNVVHSFVSRMTRITNFMVITSFLKHLFTHPALGFSMTHNSSSMCFPHYTLKEKVNVKFSE